MHGMLHSTYLTVDELLKVRIFFFQYHYFSEAVNTMACNTVDILCVNPIACNTVDVLCVKTMACNTVDVLCVNTTACNTDVLYVNTTMTALMTVVFHLNINYTKSSYFFQ